jgi:hypothetical protein
MNVMEHGRRRFRVHGDAALTGWASSARRASAFHGAGPCIFLAHQGGGLRQQAIDRIARARRRSFTHR